MTKGLSILLAFSLVLAAILCGSDGAVASGVLLVVAGVLGVLIVGSLDNEDEKKLAVKIFLGALIVRVLFSTIAYYADFWLYLAGDAETYNGFGYTLAKYLSGETIYLDSGQYNKLLSFKGSGWGMYWIIAFLYTLVGQNPIAGNFFVLVFGAATAPLTYACSKELFENRRVARIAALLVGFFPGFVNWSSFMMKDGLIIFCLVGTVFMLLRLQRRIKYFDIVFLMIFLLGIISLRFYIFPMIAVGVIGGFIIGVKSDHTIKSILSRCAAVLILGTVFTYIGAFQNIQQNVDTYGNLKVLNNARLDQATTADSGFDVVDVSTAEGAIAFLPTGIVTLMLAPFPWQITSLRAGLTMPEMVVWWVAIPFIFTGIAFSLRHNLPRILPIVLFTIMLTIGYAIFQGNIGTAYRQRAQIQVFHLMFASLGFVLFLERRENSRMRLKAQRLRINRKLRTS